MLDMDNEAYQGKFQHESQLGQQRSYLYNKNHQSDISVKISKIL